MFKFKFPKPSLNTAYFLGFLIALLFFGFSGMVQYYFGAFPHVYIYAERVIMLACAMVFLFATLVNHSSKINQICAWNLVIINSIGVLVTARHIFLQVYPNSLQSVPSLLFDLKIPAIQPFFASIGRLYAGTFSATTVEWSFYHISLAVWTLLFFFLPLLLAYWQMHRRVIH